MITNAVGLVAAVLGDKFYWWIDPTGAIMLAVYTISNWSGTVLENAGSLDMISIIMSETQFLMLNTAYYAVCEVE